MLFKRIISLTASAIITSCSITALATDDFKAPPVGRTSTQSTTKSSTKAQAKIALSDDSISVSAKSEVGKNNSKKQNTATSVAFKDNTLTVIVFPEFEPMEFYSDNKIVGIEIDIAREIAKRLGLNFEILEGKDSTKKTTFIKDSFKSKKANAFISGFVKTSENELVFSDYYFSDPYIVYENENGTAEYSILSISKEISEEINRILSGMTIDGTINKIIDNYSLKTGVKIYLPTLQSTNMNYPEKQKQENNSSIPAPPREFIANVMTDRAKSIFGPSVEIIGKLSTTKKGYKYYLVQKLLLSKETIVDSMIAGSMSREWVVEMQEQLNSNSAKNKEIFEEYGYNDVEVEISLKTEDMLSLITSIDGTTTYNVLLDIYDTLLTK